MHRRLLSENLEVPDASMMIVAARHVPAEWPVLNAQRLASFAAANPQWDYLLAGEQASRRWLPGSTLMRGAVIDRW